MTSLQEHWDKIYANNPITQLGWYEDMPFPSLQLIEQCAIPKQAPLVDIGSGVSTLIPNLLELGYQNLYAVDISTVALEKAKAQLNQEQASRVHWIVDDMTTPSAVLQLENVTLWHDRAVFHFLTEEEHQQTYRSVLQKALMPGGFIVIATFSLDGAAKCSGLPVHRYSAKSLGEFLGNEFQLVDSLDYVYHMPSGDLRPYVYACFQRKDL